MTYIQGNYYHIYNRRCNKERIFFNDDNDIYLVKRMKTSFKDYGANVIAYCLMPNHYHFLVQQNRRGTLFEGRPKHIAVDKEKYLDHLMWYIHTNPVSAGIVTQLEQWKYSNYLECIGKRNGKMFDSDLINQKYGSFFEYERFINEYQCNKMLEKEIGNYLFD